MFSVALVGPDGAGKTTISRRLENSSELRVKCVYMGISMDSSNVASPFSRMADAIKRRFGNPTVGLGAEQPRQARKSGLLAALRSWARVANRIADEWYRQLIAWMYGTRGYVVVYDRHFLLDFSDPNENRSADQRLHSWLLQHAFPRPDLVIYLDAPSQVLFDRKHEKSVIELEARRHRFLQQGALMTNFSVIDANQSLDAVYRDVLALIRERLQAHKSGQSEPRPAAA